MGSCCSAIALFTFHIYLGIFLAQGGSLTRLEWEMILVLQKKQLKSLNLNQTLAIALPLSSFATVWQVMWSRMFGIKVEPSIYTVMGWIYIVHTYEQNETTLVAAIPLQLNVDVWFVSQWLAQWILASLWVGWNLKAKWWRLARDLSRCWSVFMEASLLPKRSPVPDFITALPWHHFDTQVFPHRSLRRAVANRSQVAFQSAALLGVYVHVWMLASFQADPHASVQSALSPFRIADKRRSLCLASLNMRTQWLGLQAVEQD